jgi:hypothetical protein
VEVLYGGGDALALVEEQLPEPVGIDCAHVQAV